MRVTFLNQPILKPHGNDDEWELHKDFAVLIETDAADDSVVITVPKGVITDLASIPELPVIFLTSKDEEIDEVIGFNIGALGRFKRLPAPAQPVRKPNQIATIRELCVLRRAQFRHLRLGKS